MGYSEYMRTLFQVEFQTSSQAYDLRYPIINKYVLSARAFARTHPRMPSICTGATHDYRGDMPSRF